MKDYLLFKVTLLEHATDTSSCRTSEDILTVICDRGPSPSPTTTPTITPTVTPTLSITPTTSITPTVTPTTTRSDIFSNSLVISAGSNYISGDGITFTSSNTGDKLEYNKLQTSFDLPFIMTIIVNGTIKSTVILPSSSYMSKTFRITLNGIIYIGNFISGNINFISPTPTPTVSVTPTKTMV